MRKGQSKYHGVFKPGQRIGRWTVIDGLVHLGKEAKILTKCECGNQRLTNVHTLNNGKSTQCGTCGNSLKLENNPAWKGYKCIPYSWFSRYFERTSQYRKSHTGTITIQNVYDIWINQNKKCKLSGVPIDWTRGTDGVSASIDRIDSDGEYDIDNVQLVHKHVNIMKNQYNQDYFINMCKNIVSFTENGVKSVKLLNN